jgi:hypothetical protein
LFVADFSGHSGARYHRAHNRQLAQNFPGHQTA